MQSKFPAELQTTFTALENEGNPWGLSAAGRGDWTEAAGVKALGEGESTPLLYWVGCAGAFDDRAKRVTRAVIKILKAADVDFAVLGSSESCTGDPARRAGNEYLYQILARQNVETLNAHKVTRIITQCPHCMNALGNEYPDLGGKYEVVHHARFIEELLEAGKLKLKKNGAGSVTFHDPCYLGRWNGVIDEPRNVLRSVPGAETVEMPRHGTNSFCCGAGGARMWMEEHTKVTVNQERAREAIATGASTVAVGCPFCMTMLADGVKDHGKEGKVAVKDLAELVADALEDPA
jgi:Fe-S oxidoreductase